MSAGKKRLDVALTQRGLTSSRSQAESYVKMGKIKVNGKPASKPGILVSEDDALEIRGDERYVSRAGFKLESVAKKLKLDFKNKVVLDVGSSTGGFTDFSLQQGAAKVIAVDVGTDQLHPSLRGDSRIELHEKTDIRDMDKLSDRVDIAVIDVSFISLRSILPSVADLVGPETEIVAMLKPQFEAGLNDINKGVVKNDTLRRKIIKDFETWARQKFTIIAKADSEVAGAKGNLERFYLLKTTI